MNKFKSIWNDYYFLLLYLAVGIIIGVEVVAELKEVFKDNPKAVTVIFMMTIVIWPVLVLRIILDKSLETFGEFLLQL